MISFIELNENHKSDWDRFVFNHPNGNFFQSSEYYLLFNEDKNNEAFAYAITDNGLIKAVIVGVIESNLFYPLSNFTRRAILRGGPLVSDNNVDYLKLLLSEFNNLIKSRCIYSQIRNLFSTIDNKDDFQSNGFNYLPHLDILIDLDKDEQDIIKAISGNKRGNINKSKNKGTIFLELNDIKSVTEGINLIHSTYSRAKLPVPDSAFFVRAFEQLNPKKMLKVFGAFSENKIIGVRFVLLYKELIYDWYAGSDLDFKNRYPNDFIPFNILIWGKRNGFKLFDFGGAGKPGIPYGVREHKIKFGGKLVEYGRYQKNYNKLVYNVGNYFFKILKR